MGEQVANLLGFFVPQIMYPATILYYHYTNSIPKQQEDPLSANGDGASSQHKAERSKNDLSANVQKYR